MINIDDLLAESAKASGPRVIGNETPMIGGVDPLGLRQINFDLMDQVLPGLNNVAEKVRPFVLMTWAWRRARQILELDDRNGATDEELRDFVDRIEAIYAWSQFLADPNAGIPGKQALSALIAGEETSYRFGGTAWLKRRDLRRSSTGLISPLNYGPGLRSMGWPIPVGPAGIFRPHPELDPMLDAFEACFEEILIHEAFNSFGEVSVDRDDALIWGKKWSLEHLTEQEINAAVSKLMGLEADQKRRDGLALAQAAALNLIQSEEEPTIERIRTKMTNAHGESWASPTDLATSRIWRAVQTRQLFRLALEGMFYWLVNGLEHGPLSSVSIARNFLIDTVNQDAATAEDWLAKEGANPVELLGLLREALDSDDTTEVPEIIRQALAFCLAEPSDEQIISQANDRLPIWRAKKEFALWQKLSPQICLVQIIEVWLLAQHAYWCVGRGLADARGRGKTLLRLRVVIDEGGWKLTPGVRRGNPPIATPDRLATAISLLSECGRI